MNNKVDYVSLLAKFGIEGLNGLDKSHFVKGSEESKALVDAVKVYLKNVQASSNDTAQELLKQFQAIVQAKRSGEEPTPNREATAIAIRQPISKGNMYFEVIPFIILFAVFAIALFSVGTGSLEIVLAIVMLGLFAAITAVMWVFDHKLIKAANTYENKAMIIMNDKLLLFNNGLTEINISDINSVKVGAKIWIFGFVLFRRTSQGTVSIKTKDNKTYKVEGVANVHTASRIIKQLIKENKAKRV